MIALCREALEQLSTNLKEGFGFEPTETGCMLITPFLRSDNEHIEIELVAENGKLIITDNCETSDYLFVNGLDPERSRAIQRQIKQIAARFSVTWSAGELFNECDLNEVGPSFWRVLNAVQEASSLIHKRMHKLQPTFDEQVEKELIAHELPYESNFEVPGKSRVHRFRFYLNDQRNSLVEPITATSPNAAQGKAERLAFQWVDGSEKAGRPYRKIAVVDDVSESSIWTQDVLSILKTYSDYVVFWTNRSQLLGVLNRTA